MRPQQVQNLLIVGVVVLLTVSLGLAYWIGSQRGGVSAAAVKPIKKFRADPGTERENARALVSSIPSVKEETTDRPIEIWGSLDSDDPRTPDYAVVLESIEGLSPNDARDLLAGELADDETIDAGRRAELEAALAWELLHSEPPDVAAAADAFARAFAACPDADARVALAYVYADRLYNEGAYEQTLELLPEGRFAGAKLSPFRLALETIRGLALDALGRGDSAEEVFKLVFESALSSDLKSSVRARDATRVAAMHLARQYRSRNRPEDAIAVSRKLRAWLGEEDLVLR